jgi:predicted MFS family arabinose efflux permease
MEERFAKKYMKAEGTAGGSGMGFAGPEGPANGRSGTGFAAPGEQRAASQDASAPARKNSASEGPANGGSGTEFAASDGSKAPGAPEGPANGGSGTGFAARKDPAKSSTPEPGEPGAPGSEAGAPGGPLKKVPGKMTASILSLSLLTVMAGAAVAPALDVIEQYFSHADKLLIQMIISVPALFIVISSLFFPALCKRFRSRTLVMIGLVLYCAGGCAAGLFNSIYAVLAARALVGLGVGIIMPLSTGLLSFYYSRDKQEKMMGYSSAMNQMGAVIATLLSGALAAVSWRLSFLVYLLGMLSIVLCLLFLPNDRIHSEKAHITGKTFRDYSPYIVGIFLLMITFFIYPSNFAMETAAEGTVPLKFTAVIMAGMDFVAFFGGMLFVRIKKGLRRATRLVSPILFIAGYLLLVWPGGWIGALAGSACVGFANGAGIPLIISEASKRAGRSAPSTVLPLISAALYLAQFLAPILLSVVRNAAAPLGLTHLAYLTAIVTAVIFLLWSAARIRGDE